MPRLPAPEDYGFSVPRPARGVVDISPVMETPDLDTGRVMIGLGDLMRKEAERMDETVARDALNQLQAKQLDLTYGDSGFTKVQGRGVIERKLTDDYPTQLQAETDRLTGTIATDAAKKFFQQNAAAVMRQFKVGVYTHVAKETDQYQKQVFKGTQENAIKAASQGDTQAGLAMILPVLESEIARQGLPTEDADAIRRESLGAVHSAGITQALTAGRPGDAKTLLENAKAWMSPKQVDHFDKMVKEQTAYDKAGSMVDEARAKGLTEEQAFDKFRKEGGDKDTIETAKSMFGQYRAMADRDEAKTLAPLQNLFLDQGGSFAAIQKVVKSPGYITAPESVQVKIRDYMTGHARALQAFGRSEEAYWEAKKATDPAVLMAFSNLAGSPETLVKYDDAQLMVAMLPVMGRPMTAKLLEVKKHFMTEAGKFRFTKDQVDQYLPPVLQKPGNITERAHADRFHAIVTESLVDWQLSHKGEVPNPQQQKEIISNASRQFVVPGTVFGGVWPNTYNAYEYKPVPADFVAAGKAAAKAAGRREPTSDEIAAEWRKQKGSRY